MRPGGEILVDEEGRHHRERRGLGGEQPDRSAQRGGACPDLRCSRSTPYRGRTDHPRRRTPVRARATRRHPGTVPPMRALLVVNPTATTTSERSRDVLARALRSEVDLTVEYTRRRGHGVSLARQAVADGFDLVVTLGGDGTVNEVVNGLMSATLPTDADPDGCPPWRSCRAGRPTSSLARSRFPPEWSGRPA